jgi:hypothetical protein
MKFNSVTVTLVNVDDESANVKIDFDPPLPDDEDTIEEQPILTLLDAMLEAIEDTEDSKETYLQ